MTMIVYRKIMDHLGIEGEFLPHELPLKEGRMDLKALHDFMRVFRSNSFLQTMIISDPYKQAIAGYLDALSNEAKELKIVNFVYKEDGQLIGENKDALAFLTGLQNEINFDFAGCSMVFFGCGGVSSAIALKLASKLKKIGLVEINDERKEKLNAVLKKMHPLTPVITFDRKGSLDFSDFNVFYNGTGLGKFGKDPLSISLTPLIEGDIFPNNGLAIDANYTPWETPFLKQCAEQGFQILNGYSHMLASTSLHLSFISGKEIDYQMVKKNSELQNIINK